MINVDFVNNMWPSVQCTI